MKISESFIVELTNGRVTREIFVETYSFDKAAEWAERKNPGWTIVSIKYATKP